MVSTNEEQRPQQARRERLKERVVRAAEAALADHQYVSPIDVLTGMGLLSPVHVQSWRKGRIDFLERMIQGNPWKISESMELFHNWALERRLKPSATRYTRSTPAGKAELRFSESGDPGIEESYRTHYISPDLPAKKQERLAQELNRPEQPVVFEILRDSACSECGADLPQGSFLLTEAGQPLCLACARLGSLEFLPAGNTALTRRSTRYSEHAAVVVRFSRSRGRYERQGILVEKSALEKAEQECVEDAAERAQARAAAATKREEQDRELIARMTGEIGRLFPGCPRAEAAAIAAHTATRSSGRVGTSAGRNLDEGALIAAVTAAIRYKYTDYDVLLASGADRLCARRQIADQVEAVLQSWRK